MGFAPIKLIISILMFAITAAVVAVTVGTVGMYSYNIELNDNIYGVYIGEYVLAVNLSQLINLPLNDFSNQGHEEYSVVSTFEQVCLEFDRKAEKWGAALHGRYVGPEDLLYRPDRVDIWRKYVQLNTYPENIDTFFKVARISGAEVEIHFQFMRTSTGRKLISRSIRAYLPSSNNPSYSDFFVRLKNDNMVEGNFDENQRMQRYKDLERIAKLLVGEPQTPWLWQEGLVGRPYAKDYRTLGVIGTFSQGDEELAVSLNSLGDLEIRRELKLSLMMRFAHEVSNVLQTPIAILFRRIPPFDPWNSRHP